METKYFPRLWKGFWQLADPKIWIASAIPLAVGGALAFGNTGTFDFYWFLVSMIGVFLIEIGKNAVNEVVDYASGVDRFVEPDKRTPFSGGKKTIVDGILTVSEAKIIAVFTLLAACAIGLYIVIFREASVFWIGLTGVLFSIFYSLPPFKFAYRGFGEFIVGLTFGPLVLSGIYLVLTHELNLSVVLTALPIGFLIANVLWINQYPDYEADLKGNKKNWVVRLGKERSLKIYGILYISAYLSLIIICFVYRNFFWLLGLISLPFAVQSVKRAKEYYNDIPKLMQANAKTVIVYQFTGLGMFIAAITNLFF